MNFLIKGLVMRHYRKFLSNEITEYFLSKATPVVGVEGLKEIGVCGGLETTEGLNFLCELYTLVSSELDEVLEKRVEDRELLDQHCGAIGVKNSKGEIVFGPLNENYLKANSNAVAPLPEFLKGPHVTLFGPPDSAKLSINAMNAYHRVLANEPPIVAELLNTQTSVPKWGADDEDSKTPLREDLIDAGINLSRCFDGTIKLEENGKNYQLAESHLSQPFKRFPGLALPCSFLFYKNEPMPLHLYDFALHLFANFNNPKALTFYVPKLENEIEARYIKNMVKTAEEMIQKLHPEYVLGTVRLMIVLENPRAIFRANEIMDELYPYFAGASLGWHDYLASTARIFKNDSNYRIPVKADPNIVIKYILASHHLLADVVGPRGGIKVGGMYGVLPITSQINSLSFQITIKGYIKDVITQMKRDLTGFWVAHPDFVRLGLAMVEAWRFYQSGDKTKLHTLVKQLLAPKYHQEILDFIEGEDVKPLDKNDPQYARSLIVADIKESDFIKNNDPAEVRYNVKQTLHYLTDWLAGNGCVALPAVIDGVPVRVMDDLATAERSRWEVWHEIHHARFSIDDFLKIADEEYEAIQKDEKIVKWYPVAKKLMIQLMTDENPCEFITELLLPFTIEAIRGSEDPWKSVQKIAPNKYID
jgi:malate synthase